MNSSGQEKRKSSPHEKNKGSKTLKRSELRVQDENFGPWSLLPPIALQKIYHFLNYADRSRMSLVCRTWHGELKFPSLWNKFDILLPHISNTIHAENPEIPLPQSFVKLFKDFSIHTTRFHPYFALETLRQVAIVLEFLTKNAQLETITLDLSGCFSYLRSDHHVARQIMIDCVKAFLNSQKKLKTVKFCNFALKVDEAQNLLDSFRRKTKLEELSLRKMVTYSVNDSLKFDLKLLKSILQLKSLQTDFVHFEVFLKEVLNHSNVIVAKQYSCCLRQVKLYCENLPFERYNSSEFQGLLPAHWQEIKHMTPHLKVDVYLDLRTCYNLAQPLFQQFLIAEMPLRSLIIDLNQLYVTYDQTFQSLLRHLQRCELYLSLEEFKIFWQEESANLSSHLIEFMGLCQRLRYIYLRFPHPIESLDVLFQYLIDNAPEPFNKIEIIVTKTKEASRTYEQLFQTYFPLLGESGITLVLETRYGKGVYDAEL